MYVGGYHLSLGTAYYLQYSTVQLQYKSSMYVIHMYSIKIIKYETVMNSFFENNSCRLFLCLNSPVLYNIFVHIFIRNIIGYFCHDSHETHDSDTCKWPNLWFYYYTLQSIQTSNVHTLAFLNLKVEGDLHYFVVFLYKVPVLYYVRHYTFTKFHNTKNVEIIQLQVFLQYSVRI